MESAQRQRRIDGVLDPESASVTIGAASCGIDEMMSMRGLAPVSGS